MRFSAKMAVAVAMLLAVALSLGGTLLVRQNFADSLAVITEQNAGQHLLEKYALETELQDHYSQGSEVTNEALLRYGVTLNAYLGEGRKLISIFGEDKAEVYTNLPAAITAEARGEALASGNGYYLLRRFGGVTYMLTASYVESPARSLWLLSGYDVSRVFAQRDQQLANLWRVGALTLAFSVVVVVVLTTLLTRPVRRLGRVSARIAEGAYSVRTGVSGSDEIGDLARNFDAMAAAVEERMASLNENVQQRDDFVSAFSHELKTPMTSIIGYSDFVRSMEADPKTRHIAANHIYHEAQRLELLSQKLLSLMGLSEQPIEPAPVKLASIYAATHRSLVPLPEKISIDIEPTGFVVLADKTLIVDLLRNLVLNAMKAYTGEGVVRVFARKIDGACRLHVADSGCGIPEEELARIVEPFYMVDKSRSREQGGTGVGLALSQRIAQLHGTALSFKSRVGEGTLVTFDLPLANEDAGEVRHG